MLLCAAAPSDAAPSATVPLLVRASQCSPVGSWAGQNYSTAYPGSLWPRGTVKSCVWKFRLDEKDATYDYYLVAVDADVAVTGGQANLGANAYIEIDSSKAAASSAGSYDATKSYTSNKSCTSNFSLSVGVGAFSASVTPTVCSGYSVNRTYVGPKGASFNAPKLGGVRGLETGYLQRVPAGTVPIFTVAVKRPTYKHVYESGSKYYRETAAWTTWTAVL